MKIKQVFSSEFVKQEFEITELFYTVFASHGLIVNVNSAMILCVTAALLQERFQAIHTFEEY